MLTLNGVMSDVSLSSRHRRALSAASLSGSGPTGHEGAAFQLSLPDHSITFTDVDIIVVVLVVQVAGERARSTSPTACSRDSPPVCSNMSRFGHLSTCGLDLH